MKAKSLRRKQPPNPEMLPVYCDFTCTYASFASPDAVGACRREQAVYCLVLDTFNMKHSLCLTRRQPRLKR